MENKQKRLADTLLNTKISYDRWLEVFNTIDKYSEDEKNSLLRNGANIVWYYHERKALISIFWETNISSAKQDFYTCGMLDEFQMVRYNSPILDYGLNHLSYALLSDNMDLIDRYANLTYNNYAKTIANGAATPSYVIQCLIKEDWNEFDRAIGIMKVKTLKKYPAFSLDLKLFEGIAQRNLAKVEEVLTLFVTPKIHMRRNKLHILLNEFISHPALGYAKLAWLKGLEVNIDSPLIPRELLPIKPLENYVNDYKFL